MKLLRTGRSCHHVHVGPVKEGAVVDVPDALGNQMLERDADNWSKDLSKKSETVTPHEQPPEKEDKAGLKGLVKGAKAAGVMLAALVFLALSAQAQIDPSYYGRYSKNLVGTNLQWSTTGGQGSGTTVTNIAQNLIPAWRYEHCWVVFTGAHDGAAAAAATNITFVFKPVAPNGTSIGSGDDLTKRGMHVNLICTNAVTAGGTVMHWCQIPTTNMCSYTLWMITNGYGNWTNITLNAYGKVATK